MLYTTSDLCWLSQQRLKACRDFTKRQKSREQEQISGCYLERPAALKELGTEWDRQPPSVRHGLPSCSYCMATGRAPGENESRVHVQCISRRWSALSSQLCQVPPRRLGMWEGLCSVCTVTKTKTRKGGWIYYIISKTSSTTTSLGPSFPEVHWFDTTLLTFYISNAEL